MVAFNRHVLMPSRNAYVCVRVCVSTRVAVMCGLVYPTAQIVHILRQRPFHTQIFNLPVCVCVSGRVLTLLRAFDTNFRIVIILFSASASASSSALFIVCIPRRLL